MVPGRLRPRQACRARMSLVRNQGRPLWALESGADCRPTFSELGRGRRLRASGGSGLIVECGVERDRGSGCGVGTLAGGWTTELRDHVRPGWEGCAHYRWRNRHWRRHRARLRARRDEARPRGARACAECRQPVREPPPRRLLCGTGGGGRDGPDAFAVDGDVADADAVDVMFARGRGPLRPGRCRGQRGRGGHRSPDRRDERGGVGQHHGRERQGNVPRESGPR